MSRMIAAALLSLLFTFGQAQASEKKRLWGKPPYASAYDGLLPAGMTPTPAPGLHPSQLRGARVALVPSANFNEWARVWERWHDENGERFDRKSRGKLEGSRNNSNPRNFSEHVVQVLQPYVGELFIANDLPQARDAGADYYLIVDGWLGAPLPFEMTCWDTCHRATGSVHLLDSELRLLFIAQGKGKATKSSGFFGQKTNEAMEVTMALAIEEMMREVTNGMHGHLSR